MREGGREMEGDRGRERGRWRTEQEQRGEKGREEKKDKLCHNT